MFWLYIIFIFVWLFYTPTFTLLELILQNHDVKRNGVKECVWEKKVMIFFFIVILLLLFWISHTSPNDYNFLKFNFMPLLASRTSWQFMVFSREIIKVQIFPLLTIKLSTKKNFSLGGIFLVKKTLLFFNLISTHGMRK